MLPSRKKEQPVIQGVLAAVPMKISAGMCLRVGCKECAATLEELVSSVTKINETAKFLRKIRIILSNPYASFTR